ncbi:glucose/sorbosone dehydrogenases [Longilinea arvoryzae]|uniref:Glucose/sorbosone dehydrogenases n=1 Tax=Longilinea arvoryzae TaxID=360412 RepID=A0A0S7BED0_9CHLR|nr:PQQ-dependent sugar dehydrogenase [Longilinea arvoryzae]GAP13801.1 glucose/sorbosone dehydrogenases [Longilinea arvoryzae]
MTYLPYRMRSILFLTVVSAFILAISLTACAAAPAGSPVSSEPTASQTAPAYPAPGETASTQPAAGTPATGYPAPQSGSTSTAAPQPAASATSVDRFPDPAAFEWKKLAEGIERPTDVTDPGNGALWVLSQVGRILQVRDGQLSEVMDIRDRIKSSGEEQGLLGIALDPKFTDNRFFYVNYTDLSGNTVIARFTAAADFKTADPNSEEKLIQVQQPYANHNGGGMAFGPDGLLYLGLGDGGSGGDPHNNAQSTNTLLGKLLRIDVSQGQAYTIPPTNPYAGGGGKPEIYALGLRNPWRFSFDRATGDLYIADVGQDQYEEVDFEPAGSQPGANFGWRLREGMHPYDGYASDGANLVDPIWEYDHSQGCSITGGFVYRGEALPEFSGIYLAGDFCTGTIWGLLRAADGTWQSQVLWTHQGNLTSFGQDRSGELYYLNQYNGGLYQLVRK